MRPAVIKILKIGIDRLAANTHGSQYVKLSPLHSAFIEIAEHFPTAASSVLYEEYLQPDQALGTNMATTCTYYSKGANVLIALQDYEKAYEFLTIALATRQKKQQASLFSSLLLVSVLASHEGDLSRHIASSVFDRHKTQHADFIDLLKALRNQKHKRSNKTPSRFLEELAKNGLKPLVLALISGIREQRIRDLGRVYLSVESPTVTESDDDLKHFKGYLNNTDSGKPDKKPSEEQYPTQAEQTRQTKEYVYQLIMAGAISGQIEESPVSSDNEYTVTFSQNSHYKGRSLGIEEQISVLHDRLNQVTAVAEAMTQAGREVALSAQYQRAVKNSASSKGRPDTPGGGGSSGGLDSEDIIASGSSGVFYDGSGSPVTSTRMFGQRLIGGGGGAKRGFDTLARRRSFRQMADDSHDIEGGTDTSGFDTLDDEEM